MKERGKTELLEMNKEQAKFYDTPNKDRRFTPAMKVWRLIRRKMYFLMNNTEVWNDVYGLQKKWIGDLSGKKVLDFGCYSGNALSSYLASNAGSYLGIDLSAKAIQSLGSNFEERGIRNARLQCVDVLSDDFDESGFDVIYAQGVLHHFNPIDVLLPVLQQKLKPQGRMISLDPMQTSFLTRTARAVYHPFRSDKEWEWPFTQETISKLKEYFNVIGIQGVVGYSKWAIPLAFFHADTAVKVSKRLHSKDIKHANSENRHLWGCMQLAMCLEKRAD